MKYKTVFMQLEPVFLSNIERKLEGMALKGWMLEEVGTYTMLFRRSDPQNLKYNILINPVNEFKVLDDGPSGELEELCIADGWEFVLRRSAYVVFKNQSHLSSPIYSDPKILNDQIKKRVRNSLFLTACFAMLTILFFLPIINTINYMYFYQPITISLLLLSIALFIEACLSIIPSFVWLGMTGSQTEAAVFELPDSVYRSSSSLRFVSSLILFFSLTCLSFLAPSGNLNPMFLWVGVFIVLFTMFIGFRKKEGRYVFLLGKDMLIRTGIIFLIFLFIGFGGISYLGRDIFSTDRALRLSDFNSFETISNTYNFPSIGLFAVKLTDYSEFSSSRFVKTSIIRFYTTERMDEYWQGQIKALEAKTRIDPSLGLKGYYITEKFGMILRTSNEVIEIYTDYDLSQPINVLIIKKRLRLESIDFETSNFE
jgi:hypothetical protein